MFSRGHPCLKRRLSAVFDTVAAGPDEPLLFLYPRVASALQRRQPVTTLPPIPGPRKSPYTCRTSARPTWCSPTPLSRQSSRWKSDSIGLADNDASLDQSKDARTDRDEFDPYAPDDAPPNGKPSQESKAGADELELYVFQKREDSYNTFADIENAPFDYSFQPPRPEFSNRGNWKQGYLKWEFSKPESSKPEVSEPEDSLRELSSRIPTLASRSSRITKHEVPFDTSSIERQVGNFWHMPNPTRKMLVREKLAELRGKSSSDLDWDSMVDLLVKVQDDPRTLHLQGQQHEGIEIPAETALILSGNTSEFSRENVWFVHVRTGCRVHILDASESGYQRRVILSGSEYTIELVKERIRHINQLVENKDPLVHHPLKLSLPVINSREKLEERGLEVPLLRCAWAAPEPPARDPEHIPEPLFSTVKDFAEYVEELACTPAPKRPYVSSRIPHEHRMSRKITRLFKKEAHQRLFSSTALNIALKYLCKSNQLVDAGNIMNMARPVATVRSYNILLRNAALNRRFDIYSKHLLMMPRTHILPDADTWSSLMLALTTPGAKSSLLARMAQRGLLKNNSTARRVLRPTLLDSFIIHLNSGQDIEPFLVLMIKAAGPNWRVVTFLWMFFDAAARVGHYRAIDQLTEFCLKHKVLIDNRTLRKTLEAYRGDAFLLFHYALRILKQPGFKLETRTKYYLFHAAFGNGHYNLSRVMWQYLCMDGTVHVYVNNAVVYSLFRNPKWTGEGRSPREDEFRKYAGKVIVGIDLPSFRRQIRYQIPAEYRDKPAEFLMVDPASEKERLLQVGLAYKLVEHDRATCASVKPLVSLEIMLEAALRIDFEWRNECHDLPWLMQNVIHVPVMRDSSLAPARTLSA